MAHTYTIKKFRELPIDKKIELTNNRLKELKAEDLTTKDFSNNTLQFSYSTVSKELTKEGYVLNTKLYIMEYSKEKHEEEKKNEVNNKSTNNLQELEERIKTLEKIIYNQEKEMEENKVKKIVDTLVRYTEYENSFDNVEYIKTGVRMEKNIKERLDVLKEKYPLTSLNITFNVMCLEFLEKYED